MKRMTIPELIEQEQYCIMTPCVYDCASARAVELAGYKAMLLSGGEVGESLGALGEDEMSESELLFAAKHICRFSPLPLIIDCGCIKGTPQAMYRWATEFAHAGAKALLVEDEDGIEKDVFLKMVKAAVCACRDLQSECVVIARSNHLLRTAEDIDYVCDVLNEAMDLGAFMTMACCLHDEKKAKIIADRVKGPKIYPDQSIRNGVPEVRNEAIYDMGYRMISFHYTMKAAMNAMIEYGILNLKAGHNGPISAVTTINGVGGCSALPLFGIQEKLDRAEEYTGVHEIFVIPGDNDE